MGGLVLGLIGGAIAAGATTAGALPIFFKNKFQTPVLNNKLDFFIGLMLTITALSLHQSLPVIFAIGLGVLFVKSSTLIIENIFMTGIALNPADKTSVYLILLLVLKNIPEGMAAGASLSLGHAGLGNSLLSVIVLQNLLEGLTAALCFLSLGISPLLAFIGAAATGAVELFAGIFGGYMGHEISELMPLIIGFAGGSIMSSGIDVFLLRIKNETKKSIIKPGLVSGMMVMLIFIIWKELL